MGKSEHGVGDDKREDDKGSCTNTYYVILYGVSFPCLVLIDGSGTVVLEGDDGYDEDKYDCVFMC